MNGCLGIRIPPRRLCGVLGAQFGMYMIHRGYPWCSCLWQRRMCCWVHGAFGGMHPFCKSFQAIVNRNPDSSNLACLFIVESIFIMLLVYWLGDALLTHSALTCRVGSDRLADVT
jgi:hypothetical protein